MTPVTGHLCDDPVGNCHITSSLEMATVQARVLAGGHTRTTVPVTLDGSLVSITCHPLSRICRKRGFPFEPPMIVWIRRRSSPPTAPRRLLRRPRRSTFRCAPNHFVSYFILGNRPCSTARSLGPSMGSWMCWPRSDLAPPIHDGGFSLLKPTQPRSLSLLVQPPSPSSSSPAS